MKKTSPRRVTLQLGLRIIELRRKRGLTQERFAELVDLSSRQLQRIEAGQSDITVRLLVKLANGLETDVANLLVETEGPIRRVPGRPRRQR